MNGNKYKIVKIFPKKELSTKNVIDLLYSVFSFKLINEYFFNYLIIKIEENIKKKLSSNNLRSIITTNIVNRKYFILEYLYWSIKQSNNIENENNLLFQKKINNISLKSLSTIVDNIIISTYNSINLKVSSKTVDKINKDVFKKMSLEKIIPFLEKNHLPPLASNDAFKTHKIKSKKAKHLITNENIDNYYLYRENDIISKFPIDVLASGFLFKKNIEPVFISVHLQQSINSEYTKILKKRYTNKNNFNEAVFYLLTYYDLTDILRNGFINYNIPNIKNKKLKKLYDKSIELVGTPFTVPINKPYFGLFPDIEQSFGSLGSFYDIQPTSGTYSIHFPFSYTFIKDTIEKVENWLKKGSNLTFLLWVPKTITYYLDIEYDLKSSLLSSVNELLPKLEKSKYLNDIIYYKYGKIATSTNSSYDVYILTSK